MVGNQGSAKVDELAARLRMLIGIVPASMIGVPHKPKKSDLQFGQTKPKAVKHTSLRIDDLIPRQEVKGGKRVLFGAISTTIKNQ